MKFAVSNIGLSPKDHRKDFESLATIGFVGLEVALSRVFSEDWNNPTVAEVEGYRRDVESAGMNIVGLHSLFWERPEYSFFGDGDVISKTTDFLIKLSSSSLV